jgi:hypothetical protein
MAAQVSPGASATGPDAPLGQRPVAAWWARAQATTCASVSGGRPGLGTPRCCASSWARVWPPGNPRRPLSRACRMLAQSSPGAPATGPESRRGHRPVRARWASAQARIWATVSGGRSPGWGTPRCRVSRRARDRPRGSPRRPFSRAWLTLAQVSPGAAATGPESRRGQLPVRAWWSSHQARIRSTVNGRRTGMVRHLSRRRPRRCSPSSRARDEPPG